MTSITVSRLGKRYQTSKPPSPWEQLMTRIKRNSAPRPPREIWALKDVSFTLERGTILGVIGPNGAGKTTLLKVLSRITPPTEGRVVGRGAVAPLLELGSGLQGELTARQNISLYMTWHGISRAEIVRRTDEIVAFAEVEDFLETPLKRFSSGMYVRLAFSIAINMNPDVLLADEVLAVGDVSFQERCLQRVEEAGANGMTVLFVSHDMAMIQRLCNRVIWLSAGRLEQDGDPETVVAKYEQSAWTLTAGGAKRGRRGGHVGEHGEILSVRLRSAEGREIGAAKTNEEVFVTITYSLLTRGAMARCNIGVTTRGVLAFRTFQPDESEVVEPGIYRASLRIPPDLLADTIYTVKAGVYIYVDGKEHPIVQDNALTFRVYSDDEPGKRELLARGIYRGGAWSGTVMPRLEWQVSRERDLVTIST